MLWPRNSRRKAAIVLKPGTRLVREWHGHAYTVSVLADGFEYQGERYPSLTRIARRITRANSSKLMGLLM